MDRFEASSQIIVLLNQFKDGNLPEYEFISSVCDYFDLIKDETLYQSDYKFLRYLADCSGIPHFYNILSNFKHNTEIFNFDLNTFSSAFYESTLHTDENTMLHKFQKQFINNFKLGQLNRYLLTASTSFGKTFLVFEIIKKMNYQNVVLIFPTIALLSEILEQIYTDKKYSFFHDNYAIHTLSDVNEKKEKNIHIYTPERYLSYIENIKQSTDFDFVFVDEVYKIDNYYLIDEEVKENERDLSYRLAVQDALHGLADVLLAGPYMDFSIPGTPNYNNSFDSFLKENDIEKQDYNNYEIVSKKYYSIKSNKIILNETNFDSNRTSQFDIKFTNTSRTKRLQDIIQSICSYANDNVIVYCSNRGKNYGVEYYAEKLIESNILSNHEYYNYEDLLNHIGSRFPNDWILYRALKHGIGIHHGLIPKYIQKEIIRLFNDGSIKVLISTTTITEGVNTSAKNLVVMNSHKGSKKLKKFDAKNIAGRAGRFRYHYSGSVIDLSNEFYQILDSSAEPIKHKNYDINSIKSEVDIFCSSDSYLSKEDKIRKQDVIKKQIIRNIPESIMNQFKVISRQDKITIFDNISKLPNAAFTSIDKLIWAINNHNSISLEGLQVVIDVIKPIVRNNNDLEFLLDHKILNIKKQKEYSLLSTLIFVYLKSGFMGSVEYKMNQQHKNTDVAIQETAKFVYNTLKYQVVKYFGAFNLMYKYIMSTEGYGKFDEIAGIDKLLLKFEYNALTSEGRMASDYGVPSSIVEYYEKGKKQNIRETFDEYESESFKRIDNIINNVS